ncbi:MAG: hypothetical protein QM817_27935 [Archangium sp.]
MNRRLALLLLAVAALSLTACGPPWKVIRVSDPSALAGNTDVAVTFDYSQMLVENRPLAQWMEIKTKDDAKYPQTWADLTQRFEAATLQGLRVQFPDAKLASQAPGAVTLVVQPRTFRLGRWAPFVNNATFMDVVLDFQMNGQSTDAISVVRSYPASVTQPSVFNHIPYVGDQIGRAAGQLLGSKQK